MGRIDAKELRQHRHYNSLWNGVKRCLRCDSVLTKHHKANDLCGHCMRALQ